MFSKTKLGIITLFVLVGLVAFSKFFNHESQPYKLMPSKTFNFEFKNNILEQRSFSSALESIIQKNLPDGNGRYAVYVENLQSREKFALNEKEIFPAASLYKLIVMAAVLKEVEAGEIVLEDKVSATKAHLVEVLGGVDYGYEEAPGTISYTVDEALTRVGRISDNFAAILLTEKLRKVRLSRLNDENKLLVQMVQELGMENTSFDDDPTSITAEDAAIFFKLLYQGKVVSPKVSEQISNYLSLSNLDNRIPAQLPEGVKVIHKTGELAHVRHDAGIVYIENAPYVIVLLSKDVKYEDSAIETLAQISADVYEYFNRKVEKG